MHAEQQPRSSDNPNARQARRRTRFRLRSLFFLTAVVAVAFAAYHGWQIRNRPLTWHPFTQTTLDSHLAEGRTVLVVFYSHWKPRPLWRVEKPETRQTIRRLNPATLVANGWQRPGNAQDMTQALENLGVDWSTAPIVVIYRPNTAPEIIAGRGEYTENKLADRVIRALKKPSE